MSQPSGPRGPVAIESVPWTEFSHGARFASRYRVLSNTREQDKRKISVRALSTGEDRVILRDGERLDYWDGE